MELQQAISVLTKALNEDQALFYAYQSAIGVPFQDEVRRQGIHISDEKLHEISNNAAKYFLQVWVGQTLTTTEAEPVTTTLEVADKGGGGANRQKGR